MKLISLGLVTRDTKVTKYEVVNPQQISDGQTDPFTGRDCSATRDPLNPLQQPDANCA